MERVYGSAGFGGEEEERVAVSHEAIVKLFESVGEKAEKLRDYILEDVKLVSECEELRKRLILEKPGQASDGLMGVLPLRDELNPEIGVAVDSTFPPEGGIDMVAGVLVGVVAGYVVYRGAEKLGIGKRGIQAYVDVLPRTDDLGKRVSERARLLERRLVSSIIDKLPDGSVIVFDGEIVPYSLLYTRPRRSVTKSLDSEVSRLLLEASEKRIMLIGVVKRSYTRLFNVYASLCGSRLKLNDKAIASIFLGPGEYTVLGVYTELLPGYAEVVAEEKGVRKIREVVETRLTEHPEYGRIVTGFYKPSRVPRAWQAVKIEVYAPWLEPREALRLAASHLDALTSPATGLPYPVDLVDELVRIEAAALEVVRHRLTKLLLRGLRGSRLHRVPVKPEDLMVVTLYTNPEKRYLYQPR